MNTAGKIFLGLLGVGAAAGITYGVVRLVTKEEEATKAVAHRSALPKTELQLPESMEELLALEAYLGDCIAERDIVLGPMSAEEDIKAVVDDVKACVAADYYPDVAWPPVIGDHPSIFQAWSLIGSKTDAKIRKNLDLPPVTPGDVEPPQIQPEMPPPLGVDQYSVDGVRVDAPLNQLVSGNAQITVLGENLGDPEAQEGGVYLEPVDATSPPVFVAEAILTADGVTVLLEGGESSYAPYAGRSYRVWYTEPHTEPVEAGVLEFPPLTKQFVPLTPGGGLPFELQS